MISWRKAPLTNLPMKSPQQRAFSVIELGYIYVSDSTVAINNKTIARP